MIAAIAAGCGDNRPGPLEWGMGVKTFDARALGLGTADPPDPWFAAIRTSPRLAVPT